jgi:hypothetical protein
MKNLKNRSWSSIEEMVSAIESCDYDVLNVGEFEIDVIDCLSSDGNVETLKIKMAAGLYSIKF